MKSELWETLRIRRERDRLNEMQDTQKIACVKISCGMEVVKMTLEKSSRY